VESVSEHPLASAVVQAAKDRAFDLKEIKDAKSETGMGIAATVDGMQVRIGRLAFVRSGALDGAQQKQVDALHAQAKTVVFVSLGEKLAGALAIADPLKPSAQEAIEQMKRLGMQVVMITGDNPATARAIAKEVGIENVHAEVFPADKLEIVRRAQAEGKRVAFVGDGINDAPALTQADLGIAMGTGTDIAIESGQIILMGGEPSKIPDAIRISRKTFGAIKQNLFWAFIYNIVGIPLAALGLLNPIIAAGAMAFSSISVLLNSLRLKRL
jgi:Cu+-exporting ATPase